ncbi:MAG: alpha/beta hydrolase [Cyanobacteria bacterium J06598_3]
MSFYLSPLRTVTPKHGRSRGHGWASLVGLLCTAALLPIAAQPAPAAERISLTYGFAEISTSVEALRAYAESGEVNEELAPYFDFLNDAQQAQFRDALQARQDVSPVEISQFLHSAIGQNILRSLGSIIQTQSRRDGAKGLRGALVLAAAEPEGLSLLGILDNFPTNHVRVDSQRAFQALNSLTGLIEDTDFAIATIESLSESSEMLSSAIPQLPALSTPGEFTVTQQTMTVDDERRSRLLTTDFYLPGRLNAPLIIISHGLSSDRQAFATVAEHLASHGYAVAALDHPGSNLTRLNDLLRGTAREIADPTEFSDRPGDVSYLLDELTRMNQGNGPFANQFNMERVGAMGHSFGGYTVLALAGGQLNFDTLQTNCASNDFIFNAANPSMLLQCTALLAPEQFTLDLQDDRIKAVMAINPVTSSLFGPAGFAQIAVPSLIVSGSADPVAPSLLEQIQPFTWLNQVPEGQAEEPLATTAETPSEQTSESVTAANPETTNAPSNEIDHYLAVIQGGSHLYELPSQVDANSEEAALASELVSADIPLAYSYLKAMSLGFMQAEVAQDPIYQNALSDASIVQIGRQPLPLFLVDALTEDMLKPVPAPVEETQPTEEAPEANPSPDTTPSDQAQ